MRNGRIFQSILSSFSANTPHFELKILLSWKFPGISGFLPHAKNYIKNYSFLVDKATLKINRSFNLVFGGCKAPMGGNNEV
jgi:hypothetical protein